MCIINLCCVTKNLCTKINCVCQKFTVCSPQFHENGNILYNFGFEIFHWKQDKTECFARKFETLHEINRTWNVQHASGKMSRPVAFFGFRLKKWLKRRLKHFEAMQLEVISLKMIELSCSSDQELNNEP